MRRNRIERLRNYLGKEELDAFLLNDRKSLFYFLGFTGSSGLGLITGKAVFFVTDFRYKEQAFSEVSADEIIIAQQPLIDSALSLPEFIDYKRVGIEGGRISYDDFQKIDRMASGNIVTLNDTVNYLTAVKDNDEIEMDLDAGIVKIISSNNKS